MILICTCFLIVLSYLSVYVTRLVWKTDKFLPLMLYMLCCSLLSQIMYYISEIIRVKTNFNCTEDTRQAACSQNFLPVFPEFFLAMAVTLNAAKWSYFYIRIRTFIRIDNSIKLLTSSLLSEIP